MPNNNIVTDEMLKKAFSEIYEKELDGLAEKTKQSKPHSFSQEYTEKMNTLIKRTDGSFISRMSAPMKIAACVVLAITVISVSSLSISAVREKIADFFEEHFNIFTRFAADNDKPLGYPDTIEEEYYISEIPEGFELKSYYKAHHKLSSEYRLDNKYIAFSQSTKTDYYTDFDNERSSFESFTDENGQEYIIHTTQDDIRCIWDNGSYIFSISCNLSKEEAIELCLSLNKKS